MFLVCASLGTSAVAEVPGAVLTENGHYQVRIETDLANAPLNEFITVGAKVFGLDDQLVDGATVAINGGMPSHGHGLPTSPIAGETCGGTYLIEGLKFTMPGHWVIVLDVNGPAGPDRATFEFDL